MASFYYNYQNPSGFCFLMLRLVSIWSRIADRRSQIADRRSQIADRRSQIAIRSAIVCDHRKHFCDRLRSCDRDRRRSQKIEPCLSKGWFPYNLSQTIADRKQSQTSAYNCNNRRADTRIARVGSTSHGRAVPQANLCFSSMTQTTVRSSYVAKFGLRFPGR